MHRAPPPVPATSVFDRKMQPGGARPSANRDERSSPDRS
jgi:hypothetical protein